MDKIKAYIVLYSILGAIVLGFCLWVMLFGSSPL